MLTIILIFFRPGLKSKSAKSRYSRYSRVKILKITLKLNSKFIFHTKSILNIETTTEGSKSISMAQNSKQSRCAVVDRLPNRNVFSSCWKRAKFRSCRNRCGQRIFTIQSRGRISHTSLSTCPTRLVGQVDGLVGEILPRRHQPFGNCLFPTSVLPFSVTVRYGQTKLTCHNHVIYDAFATVSLWSWASHSHLFRGVLCFWPGNECVVKGARSEDCNVKMMFNSIYILHND